MTLKLLDLMPADTPEYAAPAWVGFIRWAIGDPDILAHYRAETGDNYQPARGPIEKMIDQATGRQEVFVRAFVDWANRTHWGAWE